MKLRDVLDSKLVFAHIDAKSIQALHDELCKVVAEIYEIPYSVIRQKIEEREKQASTAIGNGIAVPHARVTELNKIVVVVATLHSPLNITIGDVSYIMEAVFMVLSPVNVESSYLSLLARIANLSVDQEFIKRIKSVENSEELYKMLVEEDKALDG